MRKEKKTGLKGIMINNKNLLDTLYVLVLRDQRNKEYETCYCRAGIQVEDSRTDT